MEGGMPVTRYAYFSYIRVTSYAIMQDDFLQSLEFVGFTARIKRISDGLLYDARNVYKEIDFDIEPNWHLIFLLLKKEGELTVTQIAQKLKFSHPAVVKIVKKMKERGYVLSGADEHDSRKQLLKLSPKSLHELPRFEREWDQIQEVIQEFVDVDFLQKLAEMEKKLEEKGLFQRCKDRSV